MTRVRAPSIELLLVPAVAVGAGLVLGVLSWHLLTPLPAQAQPATTSATAGSGLTEADRGIIYLPRARRRGGGELDPRSEPERGIYYFARPRAPVPTPDVNPNDADYTPVGLKEQVTLAVGRGQFITPQANMLFTGEVSVHPEENVFLMRRGEIVIKFMPDESLIERPHLVSVTLINQDDRRSLEEPATIDVRLYNSTGPGHIDYNRRLFLLDRDDEQTMQIPVIPTKADWHRVRMNVTTPILIRNVKIGAVS